MIQFRIDNMRSDPEVLDDWISVVANIESGFSIVINGRDLYRQDAFPVVELALALRNWTAVRPEDRPDFEFDSMSAEEPGLVWIRREADGWRLGSIDQEYPEVRTWASKEIDNTVDSFVNDIAEAVRTRFGADVGAMVVKGLARSAARD